MYHLILMREQILMKLTQHGFADNFDYVTDKVEMKNQSKKRQKFLHLFKNQKIINMMVSLLLFYKLLKKNFYYTFYQSFLMNFILSQ